MRHGWLKREGSCWIVKVPAKKEEDVFSQDLCCRIDTIMLLTNLDRWLRCSLQVVDYGHIRVNRE